MSQYSLLQLLRPAGQQLPWKLAGHSQGILCYVPKPCNTCAGAHETGEAVFAHITTQGCSCRVLSAHTTTHPRFNFLWILQVLVLPEKRACLLPNVILLLQAAAESKHCPL
jgi:hypothetical protein